MLLGLAAMLRGSAARVWRRRLFTSPFDLKVHEISRKETVPFSADQLFAVIADVDAYAKFLPFCTASRVVGRHGPESFDAELGIGFLAFDERYVSRVTLERPRAVSAVATNSGPFAHCRTAWRLRDADAGAPGCELDFRLSMQMRTLLHDQALRRVIDRVVDQQVAAFRSRCEALGSRLLRQRVPHRESLEREQGLAGVGRPVEAKLRHGAFIAEAYESL